MYSEMDEEIDTATDTAKVGKRAKTFVEDCGTGHFDYVNRKSEVSENLELHRKQYSIFKQCFGGQNPFQNSD